MIMLFLLLFLGNQSIVMGKNTVSEKFVDIPQGNLTLKEACKITLEKNPGIQQAMARMESAKASLVKSKTAWKPNLSAQGHALAIDAVDQPDWAQTVRTSEAFNEWSAELRIAWLIFDGFTRDANTLKAKYGVEQSRQLLLDIQRLLLKAVSTTFYRAQLAMENMVIARQNQAFNRTLETDARIKVQVGTSPESEMLNFSVRALQAESDYLEAQRDYDVTCSALAQLMAIKGAQLPDNMRPMRGKPDISYAVPTFKTEFEFALAHRPDLKALNSKILALGEEIRAVRGGCFPKFYLVSGLNYLYQEDKVATDEEEHNTYIGVNAHWDIYTGGRRDAEIRIVNADIRTLREKQKETVLSIQSDIQQAIDRAGTAYETWKRQQQTVELTRRIRGHVEKAYKAGVATLTRLNEAQTDLVRASGAAAASRIQYRIDLVNLNAATGKINCF